jgi:serine/threonine-protein kinase RsbW
MIEHRSALPLTAGPPQNLGDRCGTWPLQLAPQLTKVRASIEDLARHRYAHPSLDPPEPSLAGVLERLALVVSELGGNALRHGQAPVVVSLARLHGGWLLNVADGDTDSEPALHASEEQGHRHGLAVVAIVSSAVGWYVEDDAKNVWAVVPDNAPPGLTDLINV